MEKKKPTAIYYIDCNYRRENIKYICEKFECEIVVYEGTLPEGKDVVFWPRTRDKRGLICPGCTYIVTNTTGTEHLPAESSKVISLQGETEFLSQITPTAEHTMGLIHAVNRRITAAAAHVYYGGWDRYRWGAPKMLSRSTLGIVGMGRLGKLVYHYAHNLFRHIIFYDPLDSKGNSLNFVLENSDVLTIQAGGARGLPSIGYQELIQLPKNAIVINTAKGDVLDMEAACCLVEEGHMWGIGVDTLPVEPPQITKQMKELMASGRLVITPHIGGSTEDAWYKTERFVIDKVLREIKK